MKQWYALNISLYCYMISLKIVLQNPCKIRTLTTKPVLNVVAVIVRCITCVIYHLWNNHFDQFCIDFNSATYHNFNLRDYYEHLYALFYVPMCWRWNSFIFVCRINIDERIIFIRVTRVCPVISIFIEPRKMYFLLSRQDNKAMATKFI